jgi:peptidoglycan/LPS O-acetylase OafA/YrhL
LTVTRGEGLLIGSALAVLNSGGRRVSPRLLWSMAVAGLAVIAAIIALDPAEFSNTDAGPYMYTMCVSALALLFGALVGASQFRVPVLTPALNTGWLRNLGKYSYGMYVYHLPLFYGINRLIMKLSHSTGPLPNRYALAELLWLLAATYATASLSFALVESPLLSLKRYFVARVPSRRTPEPRSFAAGA